MKLRILCSSLLLIAATQTVACRRHEGPAERAGRKIDGAAEKAGDKLEDAGDAIEDATD